MDQERFQAIVVGVSAGAVDALSTILPTLPANFRLPVIVVVHLPAEGKNLFPELFNAKCRLPVREVEDKEPVQGGIIYFAPPDYHVLVESDGRLSLSSEEPVHYSRPSIDVLFESAADAYGSALIGIVLTGANADGALGLRGIQDAGGLAIVQDPNTAYSSAMPRAALETCPNARTMSLNQIASFLAELGVVR